MSKQLLFSLVVIDGYKYAGCSSFDVCVMGGREYVIYLM